jgi:hypothetical protein
MDPPKIRKTLKTIKKPYIIAPQRSKKKKNNLKISIKKIRVYNFLSHFE